MLNERKLTKAELNKREDIIMKMKKNKRELVKRYGKDAEKVMYGRATQLAKKQAEAMDQDRIKEMVKTALQGPVSEKKGKDLDGDGDVDSQDYLAARDAAIKKAKGEKVDEIDINDPVLMKMRAANAGDDGNDKFFAKNAKRLSQLKALKDKRAQIMRDMEQEAEMEGGPTADRYGDMLNKLDKAIAMLQAPEEKEYALKEGFYGSSDIEDITNALGYSDVYHFFEDNPGAVSSILDWAENVPEFNEMLQDADLLQEDLDLGHQDNEPHMLKADLYRIGKYAMELYQMLDKFEAGSEEVDLPHWWQSKIIKSKDAIVGAKHYLDFEIKEPQIDAMVDVASEEDVIDENAIGINDRRLDDKQKSALDLAVRGDSAYTFGNDPYADDQLRYKYAVKMGFLEETKAIKEGTWSLGTSQEIKDAIHTLEMWYELDARQISALFDDKDNSNFFYNIVGDDIFHDYLNRVEKAAAVDNTDGAHNAVGDAIGRAEELLTVVQKSESTPFGGIAEKLAKQLKSK